MCVFLVGVEGLLLCVFLVGVEAQTDSSWSVEGRVWASSGLPAGATEARLYFPRATFRQAQAPPSLTRNQNDPGDVLITSVDGAKTA